MRCNLFLWIATTQRSRNTIQMWLRPIQRCPNTFSAYWDDLIRVLHWLQSTESDCPDKFALPCGASAGSTDKVWIVFFAYTWLTDRPPTELLSSYWLYFQNYGVFDVSNIHLCSLLLIWRFWFQKLCNAMIAFHCSCVNSLCHLLSSNVKKFSTFFQETVKVNMSMNPFVYSILSFSTSNVTTLALETLYSVSMDSSARSASTDSSTR